MSKESPAATALVDLLWKMSMLADGAGRALAEIQPVDYDVPAELAAWWQSWDDAMAAVIQRHASKPGDWSADRWMNQTVSALNDLRAPIAGIKDPAAFLRVLRRVQWPPPAAVTAVRNALAIVQSVDVRPPSPTPPPDGIHGERLVFHGKESADLTDFERKLCLFLWDRNEADVHEVAKHVWGHRYNAGHDGKIRTMLSKVNAKMVAGAVPLSFAMKKSSVFRRVG